MTQPRGEEIPRPVQLFGDEFTKQDLNYDFIRKINFKDIAGPSLKEIDVIKKIHNGQKAWALNKNR